MAKEVVSTFGIIDDNQSLIVIGYYQYPSVVLMNFIEAGYNVTAHMILDFRWLEIKWDYVQLIISENNNDRSVEGLRLFKRSPYLNAYYIALNRIKNEINKHFLCEEPYSDYPIEHYFKFDVHYDYSGGQYNIVVDIIEFSEDLYSNYTLYDKDEKLYVNYV